MLSAHLSFFPSISLDACALVLLAGHLARSANKRLERLCVCVWSSARTTACQIHTLDYAPTTSGLRRNLHSRLTSVHLQGRTCTICKRALASQWHSNSRNHERKRESDCTIIILEGVARKWPSLGVNCKCLPGAKPHSPDTCKARSRLNASSLAPLHLREKLRREQTQSLAK